MNTYSNRVIFGISLIFILFRGQLSAQCNLRPIQLNERMQHSSLVLEGMVLSGESLWDDKHHNIFTIHQIEVLSTFKGSITDTIVYILTRGGIVGDKMDVVTNELELYPGKTGIFTLIPTNDPVSKPYNLYEAYAAAQGLVGYDKKSKKAHGVFEEFTGVEELYQNLKKNGGHHVRRKNIPWKLVTEHVESKPHSHEEGDLHSESFSGLVSDELSAEYASAISAGATISSFSPSTVQGGIGTQLTINGTGFGATQGTSYVEFLNTNTGGASYTTPASNQYISWSDTKIIVEVPSLAGTGKFRVSDGTNIVQSSTSLTVEYAITNVSYLSQYYRSNLVSDNGSGGYTFQMYTSFDANSSAKTDFTNLVNQWICASGVNWSFGSTTTTDATASDGLNVVRFDSGSELSAGVLGLATSRFSGCTSGSSYAWYLSEIDVQVDDGTSFFYGSSGSPSGSQYDFYSVMLHEMGHAHQLGHVIDNTKLMHYSLGAGVQKRTISTSELTGALYEITQSTAAGTCSASAHIDYSCSPTVTLTTGGTTIAEAAGTTTVTATLSKRSFSAVTVNLTLSGTATTTTDYTLSTSITIPSGSLSASITLTAVQDTKYEGNETVIVDISSVTNGTESGTQQSTVTITDDDSAPTVTLTTGGTSIAEAAGTTTVTATLSAVSGLATTVAISLSGTATVTTDYTLATSISIPAGSSSASITLTAVQDTKYEGNETVIVDISSVTNGTESGTQQQTVTITDDDTAPTVTLTTGGTSIAEAAGTTTVTATLSAASGLATTVTFSFTGTATVTTDYTLSTTITIPAGSTSASNTLTAVTDALYEGNETVIVDISSVTNGTESGTQQKTVTITDDDTAPTVTLTTGGTSIAEAAGTTTVTATLSAASGLATTVTLSFTGTATVTTDYTLSTTITIPAGSTSASNTLTAVTDALYEGNETVIVDISSVTNGTESGTQQKTVTITDDDTAPTVTLTTGGTSIAEAAGTTTVTATLSAASGLATTVTLSFTGTATVTTDYTLSTTITIPAGSTSASNTLTAVTDALYEGNETVIVDISSVTNGTESGTQQQTVTITDDDTAPTVTLTTGGTSIAEAAGTTTVTATLSAASGLATTVTLSLTGTATVTTDYTLSTTITIPAGSTSASNTLTAVTDALYEGNETVIVDISSVTNGTESGTQQKTVTITDDDTAPTVTIAWSNTSIGEGAAGTSNAVVTLSAASGVSTTITLSFSGTATLNSDYTITSSSIVISAGSTTGFVTMNNIADALYEGNENITVDIAAVTNATEVGTQNASMTINDDDTAPTVSLSVISSSIVEAAGSTAVTATLSAVSGLATTVTISMTGSATLTSDYTLSTTIIIPAGSTSASNTLTAVADALYEGNETVIVDITTVSNGTESGIQQSTVSITDDDSAPTVTLSTGASSVSEAAGTTAVTATLSAVSGLATTVTISTTGLATLTSDYTLSTTISIPAGSLSASNTLTSIQDVLYEGNETVIIDISSVTNGTESGVQQSTVTITDDDAAPSVTLSMGASTVAEAGGTVSITVTQSAVSGLATTVSLSLGGTATVTSDYTLATSIIIPAGSTSASITLTSLTDALIEGDETVIIDISSVSNGTENGMQQQTLTIIDNPLPLVSLTAGVSSISETLGTATITATLSFTSLLDVTINLATSGTTTSGDYAMVSSIIIPAGNTSGSVTLSSVSDVLFEGDETVVVDITSVANGLESGSQQVTVTIADDDVAPSVTISTNAASIVEASGTSTLTATLSAVSGLPTTVTISLSGSATASTDYSVSTSMVIPAGSLSASNTITSIADLVYEGDETIQVDIASVVNGTESGVQQNSIVILDDDSAPMVSLSISSSTISESSGTSTVTATLSSVSGLATTVIVSLSGTATSTSDYTLTTSIVIPAGSLSSSITLNTVEDAMDEFDETAIIDISSVVNGTESGVQQQTVTISDNDAQPGVDISVSTGNVSENGGTGNFIATLSAISGKPVTINVNFVSSAVLNTDFSISTTSIVIPAGSLSTFITLSALDDNLYEVDENAEIEISSVINASNGMINRQWITIHDSDIAPVLTFSSTAVTFSENGGTLNMTATLSEIAGVDVNVDFSATGTAGYFSDYYFISATIPAGSLSAMVILTGIDDADDESDETIELSADVQNATVSGTGQFNFTIVDDEVPEINIKVSSVSISSGGNYNYGNVTIGSAAIVTYIIENTGTAPLLLTDAALVKLTGNNAADFSLDVSGLNSSISIGGSSSFTVTFNSACGASKTAILTVVNDDSDEGTYQININATPYENVAPVPDVAVLADASSSCSVTLTAPTATDNCSGSVTATTLDPTTYSAVGAYVVTWTFTDNNGNTATQTQNVIVSADAIAPQITCPSDITATSQTVNYSLPIVTDNCDGSVVPVLESGLASGSTFPAGTTNVTYRATDVSGNSVTCTFSVTVTITSVEKSAFASSVQAYPNPCSDYFQLDNLEQVERIMVYDNRGILMMAKSGSFSNERIQISDWANGIYFVQLHSGDQYKGIKIEVQR